MPRRDSQSADSLIRGGLAGIGLVTAATVALAAVAGLIALIVSLLY